MNPWNVAMWEYCGAHHYTYVRSLVASYPLLIGTTKYWGTATSDVENYWVQILLNTAYALVLQVPRDVHVCTISHAALIRDSMCTTCYMSEEVLECIICCNIHDSFLARPVPVQTSSDVKPLDNHNTSLGSTVGHRANIKRVPIVSLQMGYVPNVSNRTTRRLDITKTDTKRFFRCDERQ